MIVGDSSNFCLFSVLTHRLNVIVSWTKFILHSILISVGFNKCLYQHDSSHHLCWVATQCLLCYRALLWATGGQFPDCRGTVCNLVLKMVTHITPSFLVKIMLANYNMASAPFDSFCLLVPFAWVIMYWIICN